MNRRRPKPAPIGLADLDAFTLAYVACGLGKLGDDLTEAAKTFGSSDLCVGDDGRVHAS